MGLLAVGSEVVEVVVLVVVVLLDLCRDALAALAASLGTTADDEKMMKSSVSARSINVE